MNADNTPQSIYRYPWYSRWFTILFNIFAFATPTYLIGGTVFGAITDNIIPPPGVLLGILFVAIFSSACIILAANFFPEVSADSNGLYVSFLWRRLFVSWQDIIDIKSSFFNLPKRPTTWVVSTHALTPFHRLYGLLYAFTLYPSFILRYEIENREDLIKKIKRRRF